MLSIVVLTILCFGLTILLGIAVEIARLRLSLYQFAMNQPGATAWALETSYSFAKIVVFRLHLRVVDADTEIGTPLAVEQSLIGGDGSLTVLIGQGKSREILDSQVVQRPTWNYIVDDLKGQIDACDEEFLRVVFPRATISRMRFNQVCELISRLLDELETVREASDRRVSSFYRYNRDLFPVGDLDGNIWSVKIYMRTLSAIAVGSLCFAIGLIGLKATGRI